MSIADSASSIQHPGPIGLIHGGISTILLTFGLAFSHIADLPWAAIITAVGAIVSALIYAKSNTDKNELGRLQREVKRLKEKLAPKQLLESLRPMQEQDGID